MMMTINDGDGARVCGFNDTDDSGSVNQIWSH